MNPEHSDDCTHPDDEWCDLCFIPGRHLQLLRAIDAAIADGWKRYVAGTLPGDVPGAEVAVAPSSELVTPAGLPPEVEAELRERFAAAQRTPQYRMSVLSELERAGDELVAAAKAEAGVCVNRRHDTHSVRQGRSCDRPLPPAPWFDRAFGQTVLWSAVGMGAAVVLVWRAGDWLAHEGRLRVELARHRYSGRDAA